MEQVAWLDWVFAIVVAVSSMLGVWRGLVREVISVGSWFVAYAAAQWFAQDVSQALPLQGYEPPIPFLLSFALVFIGAFMLCAFVSWLLQRMLTAVGLRPIDRVLGGGFGLLRGVLILVVLVSAVHLMPLRAQSWWQESKGQEWVLNGIGLFGPLLPDAFRRYLPKDAMAGSEKNNQNVENAPEKKVPNGSVVAPTASTSPTESGNQVPESAGDALGAWIELNGEKAVERATDELVDRVEQRLQERAEEEVQSRLRDFTESLPAEQTETGSVSVEPVQE